LPRDGLRAFDRTDEKKQRNAGVAAAAVLPRGDLILTYFGYFETRARPQGFLVVFIDASHSSLLEVMAKR